MLWEDESRGEGVLTELVGLGGHEDVLHRLRVLLPDGRPHGGGGGLLGDRLALAVEERLDPHTCLDGLEHPVFGAKSRF